MMSYSYSCICIYIYIEFCKISKNTLFTEHFWETASGFSSCAWAACS